VSDTPNYASHLPVLRAVCGVLKPKRVLELGAGLHSTPFFLSLPIEELVSVEGDEDWFAQIFLKFTDERLCLRRDYEGVSLRKFDLIFIDDGTTAAEREFSIRWVLGRKHPPTIIHDAEVYATVIDELATHYAVMPTDPETAVVW
jgi:hypothetical protein